MEMIVQTSHDSCLPFKKRRIVEVLMDEANVKESEAFKIARSIERKMKSFDEEVISSAAIREEVNSQLRKRGMLDEARKHERVGIPVAEIKKTIGSHNTDNANVGRNPEAVHKYVADAALKQYALGCLPTDLARAHEKGDLHCHDLEFFPARPLNCLQQDLRQFIKYGLKVDGNGEHTSAAGPANNIETLVNHAGQVLMASQVFMSGGQSLPLMNVFMAPYVQGLDYERIKQAMQMLIFNLNMSYVSRGGQSLTYEAPLIIRDKNNTIRIVPIGEFVEKWDYKNCETLSLNRKTGQYEWQTITNAVKHKTASPLIKTTINDGRSVITTSDHSLFNFNERAEIVEVKPNEKLETILTAKQIPLWAEKPDNIQITEDEAFLIGICIGDGSLADNNGNPDSIMRIFLNKNETQTQKAIKEIVDTNSQWRQIKDSNAVKLTFAVKNPLLKKIGRGSNNKKIPDELLSGDKETVLSILDGLICSDGNINRNRIEFNTTSEQLANQIQFLLLRLGLEYNIKTKDGDSNFKRNYPVFVIQVSASSSQKLQVLEDKKRPGLSEGISQQRHDYSIIQPALNRPKRLPDGGIWEYRGQFTKANRLKYNGLEANSKHYSSVWNKVKNSLPMVVKEQSLAEREEFVYDISVEENENFVLANGIVAHNTVFSSVNLEFGVPEFLQNETAWGPGGKKAGVYGDYFDESEILRHAFTEVLLEGDSMGKPHLFPNTIYTLRDETFKTENEEALQQVHELAAKYSTPYFANTIPDWTGGHSNVMGCFSGDTKIPLFINGEFQFKSFKDISDYCFENHSFKTQGDSIYFELDDLEVYSWNKQINDSSKIERKNVSKVIINPPSDLVEIKTTRGISFKVTRDHPLFKVSMSKPTPAEDLQIGDRIYVSRANLVDYHEPGDNLSKFFGFLMGDGNVNYNKIQFKLKKTDKVKYLVSILDDLSINYTCYQKEDGFYIIRCENEWDISKQIPNQIYSNSSTMLGFIEGLLNSDGYVTTRRSGWTAKSGSTVIEYISTNKEFAECFSLISNLLGLAPTIKEVSPSNSNWKKKYVVRIFGKNAETLLQNITLREGFDYQEVSNKSERISDIGIVSVKEINLIKNNSAVYDFEVEEHHTFLAGDYLLVSGNCRTRLNNNWGNSWDEATLRTGNLAYITLNLPRMVYKGGNFYENLEETLGLAERLLLIRREHALKCMGEFNLLAFLTQLAGDEPYYRIENSTLSFGFVGMHETLLAMGIEGGITSREGQKTAIGILRYINSYKDELVDETDYRWTVLQTPAESTAHRFAELDRKAYKDKAIVNGKEGSGYYTNSTHVPVDSKMNLLEKIRIEEQYHPLTSGGHITNLFIGEAHPGVESLSNLTKRVAKNTDTGFFTYSSAFSYCFACNQHMRGLQDACSNCGKTDSVEWYDRITGYIQAVGHKKDAAGGWNAGKQNELIDRKRFEI